MAVKTLISEALLHQWTDQGSSTVRSLLETALKALGSTADASSIKTQEQPTLYRLLYELLWIVLQAKASRQDVLTLLNDVDLAKSPAACDVLIDLLWVVGNEVEAKETGRERYSSSEWQALTRFVRELADEEIVPALSLKSALEGDLLHHAGLLTEPAVMNKKLVRVNTKTYYTQVKFNLLREESEGFAKVLSLLHTGVSKHQLQATKTDLTALIGYFDLDANRVLDLALDAYEMQPQNDGFAELLTLFKRDNIPHVLGFKFQFYKRELNDGLLTPKSLYRLAATLIDKKVVDMDALMPHLSPSKEETVQLALEKAKELEKAAKAFGKVNLGSKAAADDAAADAEKAELDAAAAAKKKEDNQVLGLIMGMLDVGAHDRAFEMIKWFKERGIDALTHEPLMTQMCVYVHSLLNELYEPRSLKHMQLTAPSITATTTKTKTIAPSSPRKATSTVTALPSSTDWLESLLTVLSVLGGNLHNDSLLFTKILRVITHQLNEASKEPDTKQSVRDRVKDFMIQSLLPALSLQSCNPSTVFDMWELLKTYPFDERYRLYQQWESLYTSSPAMQLVEAQCVQNTRKIMRRLTADRAKPSARSLTHIAHANPLVVFRTMLRQIQSYDNLIQPVVESLKFITPMGMDVLSFVLVSELSMSRKSMKADGTNISLWLVSLANFSGSFYRRYPNVELGGLLQYLIKRLENWESVDLVVLSELLSKMGSCITFEDISASQLEAHAGGPHLWQEPSDPKLMNRRAIPRLREALIKRNLALPLCLLICQVRSKMENQEDSSLNHLKLLGRMSDTSQMTLSQLLQFLNGVVDPAVYTKMLPSVSELVQDYHILPELAMTVCRPAIRFHDPILSKAPRGVNSTSSSSSAPDASDSDAKSWNMQSSDLLEDVGRAVTSVSASKEPFTGMTKDFFVTFWSMTLYDIHVPFPQYEAEISRLRASLNSAQNANANMTPTERKNLKNATTVTIDKLINEQKDQVTHRKRVFELLETKKKSFFLKEDPQSQTAVNEVLQKCIIPRALLSPEDALFCAKFMGRMHHINTPAFSTLQYYNKTVLLLPSIVLCVTEREAGNFGIFLKESMGLLYRWNQSSVTYDEEAVHGKTGFSMDLANPTNILPHRHFKSMYAKCHRSMVHLYSKTLASDEYMSIRNSLIVLTKLIDVFPSGKTAAECLIEVVEPLTQETREDIKIMARRYSALLNKRKTTLVDDKMLAVGLNPPQKKAPVEPKKVEENPEDGESGQEKDTSDRESVSRESRERGRSSTARDGGRRGGDNGSSSREDRARGDRRGVSNSRDDAMETGEVKGEGSGNKDRGGRSERESGLKRRDSMRADDRSVGNVGDGRDGGKRDQRRGGANDRDSGSQKGSRQQESDRGRTTPTSEVTEKREDGGSREPQQRRSRSRSAERRANKNRDRERERERERQKDNKDGKNFKDAKDGKEVKEVKDAKDSKHAKETKDIKDTKIVKDVRENRDTKDSRDIKDTKDARDGKETKDIRDAKDSKDTREVKDAKESKDIKDVRDSKESGKREASQDDGVKEDSRKRQRLDTPEAILRRQLTEKKDQDQRKSAATSTDVKAPDAKVETEKPIPRREAPTTPSDRTSTPTNAESSNEPAPKKMISLVSSSRKREREREAAAEKEKEESAAQSASGRGGDDENAGHDAKRRREGGSGGGNGRDDGGNRSGGRGGDQQQNRRNADDRRKQQQLERGNGGNAQGQGQNQSKQKGEGGQQRDGGRNNRPEGQRNGNGGGGNREGNRGGGGRGNNNERRRDSGGNNNGDRRGGGGNGGGGNGGGRR